MTDLRDKIARALSVQTTCDGDPHPSELHFRQADAVLAVLDLDKIKAEEWDRGHSWGWSDAQEAHDVRQVMDRRDWPLRTPNPYRKAER